MGPFQIPIYRYRHNRSQNNFALFAYSNPIDVGTDFLLSMVFSVGTDFLYETVIWGGGRGEYPQLVHSHCTQKLVNTKGDGCGLAPTSRVFFHTL